MSHLIRPALDLSKREFERVHRGILCFGTWYTDNDNRGKSEPCLVLLDPSKSLLPGPDRAIPVIIPLSEAWRYAVSDDKSVGDPRHAGIMINEWLGGGILPGNPHNPRDHIAILSAINDCLRDLIHMPPKPKGEKFVIGDVIMTDRNTGKTTEKEVATDV